METVFVVSGVDFRDMTFFTNWRVAFEREREKTRAHTQDTDEFLNSGGKKSDWFVVT